MSANRVGLDTNVSFEGLTKQERFDALLKQLGAPDENVTRDFLANRQVEQPSDIETAKLIAKVEDKISSLRP